MASKHPDEWWVCRCDYAEHNRIGREFISPQEEEEVIREEKFIREEEFIQGKELVREDESIQEEESANIK